MCFKSQATNANTKHEILCFNEKLPWCLDNYVSMNILDHCFRQLINTNLELKIVRIFTKDTRLCKSRSHCCNQCHSYDNTQNIPGRKIQILVRSTWTKLFRNVRYFGVSRYTITPAKLIH